MGLTLSYNNQPVVKLHSYRFVLYEDVIFASPLCSCVCRWCCSLVPATRNSRQTNGFMPQCLDLKKTPNLYVLETVAWKKVNETFKLKTSPLFLEGSNLSFQGVFAHLGMKIEVSIFCRGKAASHHSHIFDAMPPKHYHSLISSHLSCQW